MRDEIGVILIVFENVSSQLAEKGRIDLLAARILRAQIAKVRSVSQSVLRDQIDVTPIEDRIEGWFAGIRNEAVAEDHVGRVEAAWIRAAEEDRVSVHFGINELRVWPFQHLL